MVLDSVSSPITKRVYNMALDEFLVWFQQAPRPGTVGSLAFRASRRRGLSPFWAGVVAAVLILVGKFYFESALATYVGVSLLILASLWNSWPPRTTAVSCVACLPAEEFHKKRNAGKEGTSMKHKIEIFSEGCATCKDTIEKVRNLAGPEDEVHVHDMLQHDVASRATQHGIRSVPAVVIDGKLAGCCAGRGADKHVARGSAIALRESWMCEAATVSDAPRGNFPVVIGILITGQHQQLQDGHGSGNHR